MALTTANWMPQYGAARNKAKDALKKGTPASDIDWMELQTLAERAGVADLYSKEDLIRENYVPTNDPALASSFAVGDSKGTASTFGDLDPEVDADAETDALPYTQAELDAVDIEDVLSRFNLLGGDAQVAIDNLQNAVATGSITPAEEAAFTSYAQSGEWQKRIDSVIADQREQDFQDEDSGDELDRGDDGLREGRYNEFVRMLREDPYRTDIDINAIYDEDPALGDMVNSYLGSSEYLAAQRDADSRGAEVDEQADEQVDDIVDDEEVVEWNYDDNLGQFVNDNYAKFKSRVAAGDDIESSVADALLSAGATVEIARGKAKDAATFIIGRVQNELDEEAADVVEEEPETEVEVEEEPEADPIITEDDPVVEDPVVEDPIVEDPIVEDPVVVVDVAGNEVVPVNDAQADMDESVNEILRLIDGVDFSDVTQIEEVRGTIEGVFKDYGVALDGILSIEGASNVIDKYIDDILVQSLEQSTDLFQDTDSEETFGRKAEAGIEISMERIIDNLAIDEKEILDKTSTLIDQKYDDALERLGRLGLLEGGGIGASGANIRQATELESARATELIQAELEVGEKYRAELRETLQLFENIKTSRASEAIEEQRVRIDTTQQLLDFVVSLEEIRLGGRAQDVSEDRLLLEERSLDIEDFRARSDERLREAELTGLLDDEETLAMREVMSRIELDKRRLDLEAKIADRELSIQEKAQALNDLVQIRSLNLEAKKFNLEEALGLGGLDLQDRRMALDEIMGKAGMSIEERKLALDTLLGEGELAIRADLAAAEIEQVSISNYLAQQADRRAEIELKLQEGEINNRMALDLRRLDLETFISSNDIELRTRGLDIQETELTQRAAETDEEFALRREQLAQEGKLGFARLEQEGQRIGIEERRVLLDEMIEVGRLNLATQQLAFEELMSNKEYDLAERKYYTDELLAKRGLDQRDREILTNEMLANSKISIDEARLEYEKLSDEKRLALEERGIVLREDMTEAEIQVLNRNMQLSEERLELEKTSMANTEAARAFEQSMALADRTGFYIDVNGDMIPTMASRTSEREFELRQQGLDLEADRIRISSDQFNESLKQQISEFAATHNLNLRETEALIAKTEADIAAQSAMLEQDIAQADEENKINWESLRLRGIEIEAGRDATDEEMAFRREQLQLQIEQQNLDRANDAQQFADSLDLSLKEFESAQERWETEWLFTTQQAAQEFGLREEEFAMLKWQIEQDVQLRNKSLDEASAQWAAEFGLDEEQVQQAMEFADATFSERVRAIGLENNMTEAQSDALVAELEKFNKEEQRRDVLWEDVLDGNIDWDNEDDVKEFAAHMAIINGTGIGSTGGGLFAPEPGMVERITAFGTEWLIKEYGEETANAMRGLLGEGYNLLFGGDGDDGTAEWLMENGVEGVDWLMSDDGLVEDLRAPGAGVSTEATGAVAAVASKVGPAVAAVLPWVPAAAAAAGVIYTGNKVWNTIKETQRLSEMSMRERDDEWRAKNPDAAKVADQNQQYFDLWFDGLPFNDQKEIYNSLMTDDWVNSENKGDASIAWDGRTLGGSLLDGQFNTASGVKDFVKLGNKHSRDWAASLRNFESSADPNALINAARNLNTAPEDGTVSTLDKNANDLNRSEVGQLEELWDSMTGDFRKAFLRETTGLTYSDFSQHMERDVPVDLLQEAAATYIYSMDIMSQDKWQETYDSISDTIESADRLGETEAVAGLTVGEISTINKLYDQWSTEDFEVADSRIASVWGKNGTYEDVYELDPESDEALDIKLGRLVYMVDIKKSDAMREVGLDVNDPENQAMTLSEILAYDKNNRNE